MSVQALQAEMGGSDAGHTRTVFAHHVEHIFSDRLLPPSSLEYESADPNTQVRIVREDRVRHSYVAARGRLNRPRVVGRVAKQQRTLEATAFDGGVLR